MTLLGSLVFLIFLVIVNAFYVAAEFALLSTSLVQLEKIGETEAWARRLHDIKSNSVKQDRYVAVAQLGITLASLGLGMYSEHALANQFQLLFLWLGWDVQLPLVHWAATLLSLGILTYIHVVLGEMVPKTMALLSPLRVARFIEVPMEVSSWILAPLAVMLNGCGNLMLKMVGLPVDKSTVAVYSEEELSLMLEESKAEGLLGEDRHDWCQHLLNMKERTVRQVMVPRIKAVGFDESMTLEDALAIVKEEGYSRYPLFSGDLDHIDGVIHVRDMYAAIRAGRIHDSLVEFRRECPKFPESLDLDQAFDRMRAAQAHLAAVVDEYGGIAGIVTLEDLVEEVFGEVFDEFDETEVDPIVEIGHQRWQVAGSVLLEDLSELTGCDLEQEEVDTVSGLVMDELGRLPVIGDRIIVDERVAIEVLSLANMVPSLCRVTLVEPAKSPEEEK